MENDLIKAYFYEKKNLTYQKTLVIKTFYISKCFNLILLKIVLFDFYNCKKKLNFKFILNYSFPFFKLLKFIKYYSNLLIF